LIRNAFNGLKPAGSLGALPVKVMGDVLESKCFITKLDHLLEIGRLLVFIELMPKYDE